MNFRFFIKASTAMALFMIMACGCSNLSTPSNDDLRRAVESNCWLTGFGHPMTQNGTVKIISFKKLDGKISNQMGEKVYMIRFEAEAEYLKREPENGFSPGQKERRIGIASFTKWESGWKFNGGRICGESI